MAPWSTAGPGFDPMRSPGPIGVPWQIELLESLAGRCSSVQGYGSVLDQDSLDGWSDLDVRLDLPAPITPAELFGADAWAWQLSRTDDRVLVRLVLADGRRIDADLGGAQLVLAPPPADLGIRFDAALALSRLGRGADLIGLHLLLGIAREALVLQMQLADRDQGRTHHRQGTPRDDAAAELARLLSQPLAPSLAIDVAEVYGRWRQELEAGYRPDWTGLQAVFDRGADPRG